MPECVFEMPCALDADAAYALLYTPEFDAYLFREHALGRFEDVEEIRHTETHEHRRVRVWPASTFLGALSYALWLAGAGNGTGLSYVATQRRSKQVRSYIVTVHANV